MNADVAQRASTPVNVQIRQRPYTPDQPKHRSDYSMIAVRMATGVRKHFHIRATEWVMLFPAIGLGVGMIYQDHMFATSPSYQILAGWAPEPVWSVFLLLCALLRLSALAVNGTFQGFGVSPHMRLAASLAGAMFWSQFSLGFLVAFITGSGSISAPLAYSTFCLMEVLNITRSWADVTARKR